MATKRSRTIKTTPYRGGKVSRAKVRKAVRAVKKAETAQKPVVINMTINVPNADSFKRAVPQLKAEVEAAMREAMSVEKEIVQGTTEITIEMIQDAIRTGALNDGAGMRRNKLPEGSKDPYASVNPKDLQGIKKPPLHLIPPSALIYESMAFLEGASKYDPYNWREKPVKATVYISALLRHVMCYLDGQEVSSDAGVPHLANARACLAILIDAKECGNLVDDRPKPGKADEIMDSFKPLVEELMKRWHERLSEKDK